jgi:hypothetical protein
MNENSTIVIDKSFVSVCLLVLPCQIKEPVTDTWTVKSCRGEHKIRSLNQTKTKHGNQSGTTLSYKDITTVRPWY